MWIESDEDGGFHEGCQHKHGNSLEAQGCIEANINSHVRGVLPVFRYQIDHKARAYAQVSPELAYAVALLKRLPEQRHCENWKG